MSLSLPLGALHRAHERGRLLRPRRLGAGDRLPLLRADPRRETVTFAGWLTIVAFAVILTALAIPLGSYMAKVYTGKRVFLTPVFAWPERFLYKVLRVDPEREQDWKAYAKSLIVFSLAGLAVAVPDPAHAERLLRPPRAQPAGLQIGHLERHVQHGLVVHDEHQLAVLQRRDDDELPQPDDRADGPELAVGRRRDRRGGRADPRDHRAQRQEPRQLLAGPRAHDPVRARAAVGAHRDRARLPGRDREPQQLPDAFTRSRA